MVSRTIPSAWAGWLALGVPAIVVYFLIPNDTIVGSVAYDVIGLASVVMILHGVRRNRPMRPSMWYCFAAGQGASVMGDMTYHYLKFGLHEEPFPSVAVVFYLAAYPLMAAGMFIMIRGRTSGRDRVGLIDAAIIATGMALLSWSFLMRPIVQDDTLGLTTRLVSLAYPAADVLLIAMAVRLITSPGARSASYRLVCGALGLSLFADISYAVVNMISSYDGGVMDAGWLLSYVVWGSAALHPSMRALSEVAPDRTTRFTRRRLAMLAATSLLAPAILAEQGFRHPQLIDWQAVCVGSVVLFLLVLTRMAGLVSQVQDQATQLDALAHNDGLTGIPNRRAWDLSLVQHLASATRTGQPVHAAIIDLDYFKAYNDRHGHQAGDRLLKEAAAAWQHQLADGDLLARYGGEEFGVLINGQTDEQALAILHRLQAVTPHHQTFSAGLALWNPAENPERLVERADHALYEAKHAGRDRVVAADQPPPAQPRQPPAAVTTTSPSEPMPSR
jgi:diguanylate cyclase (GGDEF)-like protein